MKKERLEKTVDKIITEVTKHGRVINKITVEVMKHTEAIKGLVTKKEFTEFKNESFDRSDKIITILNRLDQERVFTFERVKRIEEEVERIKEHLSIP